MTAGDGASLSSSARIEEELDELRQELSICEAELGVWKHRLSVALKKGQGNSSSNLKRRLDECPATDPVVPAVNSLQNVEKDPTNGHSAIKRPRSVDTSTEEPRVAAELISSTVGENEVPPAVGVTPITPQSSLSTSLPTPTPLSSPTNGSIEPLASMPERQKLLQALRDEKAKAQRREKLLELQKTAEETLKKQRIARAQLELAERKELPTNYQPFKPSVVKPTAISMASFQRPSRPAQGSSSMSVHQRTFKRSRLHATSADVPPPVTPVTTLERHMYELPQYTALGLDSAADVVSHLFRVCIRWILETNEVPSVDELEARFLKYAGKDYTATNVPTSSTEEALLEVASIVKTFPLLHACVSGQDRLGRDRSSDSIDVALESQPSSLWNMLVPHEMCTGDHLFAYLTESRENILSALSLSSRLQSKESTASVLDLVLSQVYLAGTTQLSSALHTLIPGAPPSDVHVTLPDLYALPSAFHAPSDQNSHLTTSNDQTSHPVVPFSIDNDSPLLQIRAYRFHPSFAITRSNKRSLLSATYANTIDPMKVLCPYELNGVCNDDRCEYQHERDYLMSQHTAYSELMRCLEGQEPPHDADTDPQELERRAVKAVEKFHASSSSSPAELLVAKSTRQHTTGSLVSTRLTDQTTLQKHAHSFCTFMEPLAKLRSMAPSTSFSLQFLLEDELHGGSTKKSPSRQSAVKEATPAAQVTQLSPAIDDENYLALEAYPDLAVDQLTSFERYYAKDCTQSLIQELELQVEQHPEDVDAWISLAFLHVDVDIPNIDDVGSWCCQSQVFEIIGVVRSKRCSNEAIHMDKTLHILARALEVEANLYNEVLWHLYLEFYTSEGAYELAEQATRFLPGSAKLWMCQLDLCKFESVADASFVHATAIEKMLKHSKASVPLVSQPILSLIVRWCNMFVDAGHVDRGRQLLLSILEDTEDKPTCLAAFQLDPDHLAKLWLIYLDLMLFDAVSTPEDRTLYDYIYSYTAVQVELKRQHARGPAYCCTVFRRVLQGMQSTIGSNHLGMRIALVNHVIIQGAVVKDHADVMQLIESLEEQAEAMPPRLCHTIATTVAAMGYPYDALATRWAARMTGLSSSQENRMYACILGNAATDQTLLDRPHYVSDLLQWTESLSKEALPGVARGILLLHAIARLDGVTKASQHLDWVLRRPSVLAHLPAVDQHHLWSLRLQWAIQLVGDGDKVIRRYIQSVDSVPRKWTSVAAAIEWCFEPSSRRFGFALFSRYTSSIPKPLHAPLYASFAQAFACYPPFFAAYAQCQFSSDRDRFAFTSALRLCITALPRNSMLLRVAVHAELAHLNRAAHTRLRSHIKSCMLANPIAAAPYQIAFALDTAFGNSKLVLPQLQDLTQLLLRRGILDLKHAQSSTTAFSIPGNRLVHVPPSLSFMKDLCELKLSRNCLLGLPDTLFLSLRHLQVLDLSFNSLLRLPESIVGLSQLRVLNVSHNHLQDLPLLFGQLHALEDLDVSWNLVTGLPSTFVALKNLRRVNARGTYLSMDLLRRSITWLPCTIEANDNMYSPGNSISGLHVPLHASLGPCAHCHKNAGKTQRFNAAVLCPKCILVALLPLL
ncbi:hypothetical protein H310_00034 [Aphanomyces invadans]|uniref:C3H1-type domain-containing protein n=1 Tax=Aphanomyces invadans TaxID=157072 RepID=A0A024USY4_9STRA|nr:hypothetical protein H310_00034 [Aphanomyces invadans]ETW09429.1 hypothetical protein H310_00034 [Aphanomyces invadans]|eukprot:XP_008860840.1 hypothetical protein H310_00034 [Aphanomyces invadans]